MSSSVTSFGSAFSSVVLSFASSSSLVEQAVNIKKELKPNINKRVSLIHDSSVKTLHF